MNVKPGISINVYEDSTGSLQLSIDETHENGSGHGQRLAGPKFTGSSRLRLSKTLNRGDVASIRWYLNKVRNYDK